MKIARISFLAFMGIAIAIAGLWPARQNIAQRFAVAELETMGLGPARLTIGELGFEGLTLTEISLLGGALTVEHLSATYTPDSLMAGTVLDIKIDKLATKGNWTESGLTLPIVDALPKGQGKAAFAFPFKAVTLSQAILDITTPQGSIQASADLQITNEGRILRLEGSHSVNGDGLSADGRVNLKATTFDLKGISGEISQNLDLTGFTLPGQEGVIDGQGKAVLSIKGPEATLAFLEPLKVSQGINSATLTATEDIALSLSDNELSIKAPALSLHAASEGTLISLDGAVTASLNRHDSANHKATLNSSRIRIDNFNDTAVLKDVSATYRANPNALHMTVETLEVPGVLDTAPPIRLSTTIKPDGDLARFSGTVTGKGNPINLNIEGSHNLSTGNGKASIDLAALAFQPDGFQPADLMPRLIEFIQAAQGALSSSGTLSWSGKGLTPDIQVLLADLSFSHGFLGIKRTNGVIAINSLTPLSTPKGQQLAIAAVEAGVPLTGNELTFQLRNGNTLAIEQGLLHFAGGKIRLGEAKIPLDGAPVSLDLDVQELDLSQLTALTELNGLSASGTLSGRLPATLVAGDLTVKDAILKSDSPGILRYRPNGAVPTQAMGGGAGDLAWQALDNFHYTSMTLGVDGRTGGDMTIAIHLAGANPDVYDGYPMELNLNVQGRLAQAFSQSMAGYQIPKRIEEKMKNFNGEKSR